MENRTNGYERRTEQTCSAALSSWWSSCASCRMEKSLRYGIHSDLLWGKKHWMWHNKKKYNFSSFWKGSKSSEYEEMQEKLYTKIFPNGTLLLQNVKEDREGFYMCQANNGIGNGLGKVIQLKVNCTWTKKEILFELFLNYLLSCIHIIFFLVHKTAPPYFVAPSKIVNVSSGGRWLNFTNIKAWSFIVVKVF